MDRTFSGKIRYLAEETSCPVCGSAKVKPVLDLGDLPVHCNLLWGRREEAIAAPRGKFLLSACRCCGHLFNAAFRPGQLHYEGGYENSLHFSPLFQEYAGDLARRLLRDYGLAGRTILEIGCGRGDFLALLVRLGAGKGIGFDPGWEEGHPFPEQERLAFFREPFTQRHSSLRPDFVCCRHVLEHLDRPLDLLRLLRNVLRPGTPLYAEVPDARFVLGKGIWDLIYEHPAYFSDRSLAALLRRSGFDVVKTGSAFHGQYLQMEAIVSDGNPQGGEKPEGEPLSIDDFRRRFAEEIQGWRGKVARFGRGGKKAVIWGAGSKGVSFLNHLGVREEIEYAVDLNPRKHGKFITGSGQRIVPPEFLRDYRPDVVVVMNPVYRGEIAGTLREMGVASELMTL